MKKILSIITLLFTLSLTLPQIVFADTVAATIDTGDTTFVILSIALVFLMTPALAFFYGGLVRKKNLLNTMFSVFIIVALISIQWLLFGYSLAFAPDHGHVIGGFDWAGFNGVGFEPNADYAATIPHTAFALFQLMFAIITPALIVGSWVERTKFKVIVIFVVAWATLVYDPLAHMVWGTDGYLRNLGSLDFAGGTVVHISSGIAGLVGAIVIGKRKGFEKLAIIPNNLPYVLLGGGLLWFGWFGFNGGSALAANGLALNAILTTNTSAAAALLSWVGLEWYKHGKPTLLGAVTGALVGLVAITPAAGFVTPLSAVIIGLLVSPICYFAVTFIKTKFGYDDSLDAFGCHGVGGIFGALATGLFATKSINPAGNDGLFYGNAQLFVIQLESVLITIAFSAIMTFVILKVISLFTSLRPSELEERQGLDMTLHGEDAYSSFNE